MGIYAICSPPDPDTTTGACLYPATCDATFAGTPVLDVTTAQLDFRLPFQINNALAGQLERRRTAASTPTTPSSSPSRSPTPGASLAPWNVAAAITVPTAGSSGALLRLIPVQYFPALAPAGSRHARTSW